MGRFQRKRFNGNGGIYFGAPTAHKSGNPNKATDDDFEKMTADQQFRQDHFLNEVVFPHLLDDAFNSPRYQNRFTCKQGGNDVYGGLREGLIGDLIKWLAKREKRVEQKAIGTYSAAILSKAGNDLVKMTYEEFLSEIYGETLRPSAPRIKERNNV